MTSTPAREALEEYARPGETRTGAQRLNVLVIMTDTLRPDHIAGAGNSADSPQEWEARQHTNPGSTAPGSTAPGSSSPESTAPGSSSPESTAPGSGGTGSGGISPTPSPTARRASSPWIDTREMDRFARDATVFPRAYAGSFPTVPCRTDCFTGRTVFPVRGWSPLPAGRALPGAGAAA